MDDEIFDPWSPDEVMPPPKTSRAPRWRSPESAGPTQPVAPPPKTPRSDPGPSTTLPRSRLSGTPGFLRTMAAPRLGEIAQRLAMARHEALVEDLLDAPTPVIRFILRPWQGPLSDPAGVEGRLEIGLQDGGAERVFVRSSVESPAGLVTDEEGMPTAKLGASWLEGRALAFVERVLRRA